MYTYVYRLHKTHTRNCTKDDVSVCRYSKVRIADKKKRSVHAFEQYFTLYIRVFADTPK